MRVLRPGDGTANEWRYVQPETGAVMHGFSYWAIKEAVVKHRSAMKLDLSEGWEERFQDELCRQNEQVPCDRREKQPITKKGLSVADLKRFMNTLLAQKGVFVSQEEAERRATICSTCPKNQSVPGCWGCSGIMKMVAQYLGKKHTSRDRALESCAVCGCVLRAKVWLEMDTIDNTGLEYPEHCWQRKPSSSDSAEA